MERFLDAITLHRDNEVRVVDKPYGLAVQNGTRTTEHLDGLLMARAEAGLERLRLVHRLDKETSGCLVLAATRDAARLLGREFMARRVTKTYLALVHGVPEPRTGRIALPLIKAPSELGDRVRPALDSELDQAWSAVTHYTVVAARLTTFALVRLSPETGRQHQLRAHLWAIGHPIVGDAKYLPPHLLSRLPVGARAFTAMADDPSSMLQLLAQQLTLRHPKGHMLSVAAPLPPHMWAMLDQLGLPGPAPSATA